ncbi:hypothetical protein PybrP1_001040, partial [[Pythium] brassicae (nom. inval.)]
MSSLPTIASRGYFSAATGAPQLLHALQQSPQSAGGAQVQYLGEAQRERSAAAAASPSLPFTGVRVGGGAWVVGSHKTHITPLDDMD